MSSTKARSAPLFTRQQLIALLLPLIAEQTLNVTIGLADTLMVSSVGEAAVSGVSLVDTFNTLLIQIMIALATGGAVVTSQYIGHREPKNARAAAAQILFILSSLSCLVAAIVVVGRHGILRGIFGSIDADVMHYAETYFLLSALSYPFIGLYNAGAALFRAQGNSKISMLSSLVMNVVNIGGNAILIFGFGMGVRGAAIATVLSQAVGACWILRFLTGDKTTLQLRWEYLKPEKRVILPVMALGISSFVMLSTESLLSISFSSSLARYGGDVAVGAMTVITSASQLATLPLQGVCQGGQPVMSFNFGAGNKQRVREAFRFQLTLCGGYTCLFWMLMMLVPGAVAGIFTSDAELIRYTTWAMRIYMAGICAMGFQVGCQQSFMALGQAKVSLLLACLRKIILLIPLIFILPLLLPDKVFGVFLAEPVSDILAATITTITFFSRFDKILDRGAERI